jgi:thioesterase domain-containing protein
VSVGSASIVPFRITGEGSPLFCVPGSGRDAHVFRDMVATLPEGQPVYVVDMERLSDARQDFTVEQLAEFYLDRIRAIQKHGPYYLCGYSFGGLVAYEMATRLVNEGDSAALVALLDAPNPAQMSTLSAVDSWRFRKTYLVDRLKRYAQQLARGDLAAFAARARAFVVFRARNMLLPRIKSAFRLTGKPLPKTLHSDESDFVKAWSTYIPKRYPLGVVCFRAGDRGPEHNRDPSMGWGACVMGGVQVHDIPASHVEMMVQPAVRIVAEKLATYLDRGSALK